MNWQHLYLGLHGRTSKRDFWIGLAGLVGVGVVAALLPVVGEVASLALVYPAVALMAKRLHDFGRSGRLVAIPLAPPALMAAMILFATMATAGSGSTGAGLAAAGAAVLLSTLSLLVGVAFLIWVGTRDGDPAANRYGQPALDPFAS